MGESLRIQTERAVADEEDRAWRQIYRSRSMEERLERAFDAAGFADELRGAAGRR
jgi:hypothetical protein